MAKVIWLDDAKDDVRAILEYMDAENPAAAADEVRIAAVIDGRHDIAALIGEED